MSGATRRRLRLFVAAVLAVDAVAIALLVRNCDRPDQLFRIDPCAGLGAGPSPSGTLAPEEAARRVRPYRLGCL